MYRLIHKVTKDVVLRTTFRPLPALLYRALYALSLKICVAVVKGIPQIQAIFVRRGYAAAAWIPGYSDIDISLVMHPLSPASEVATLQKIWRRIRVVKTIFPYISDIHIVNEADLAMWMKLGPVRRFDTVNWRLVHGQDVERS